MKGRDRWWPHDSEPHSDAVDKPNFITFIQELFSSPWMTMLQEPVLPPLLPREQGLQPLWVAALLQDKRSDEVGRGGEGKNVG